MPTVLGEGSRGWVVGNEGRQAQWSSVGVRGDTMERVRRIGPRRVLAIAVDLGSPATAECQPAYLVSGEAELSILGTDSRGVGDGGRTFAGSALGAEMLAPGRV